MTIQQAIKNIDVVVANTAMKREEHGALIESVTLVTQRCNLADKLEKEIIEINKALSKSEKAKHKLEKSRKKKR